jgi:hypothetical protein
VRNTAETMVDRGLYSFVLGVKEILTAEKTCQ